MCSGTGVTFETVEKRFHNASKAAEEARRVHDRASTNVRIAASEHGEDSSEYKQAVEVRRAALRDLKEKNKQANEAGQNLDKYVHSGNMRRDMRYSYNKPKVPSNLMKTFDDSYSLFYNDAKAWSSTGDRSSQYKTYLKEGERVLREEKDLVKAFVKLRGDYITSDRETAALGRAYMMTKKK